LTAICDSIESVGIENMIRSLNQHTKRFLALHYKTSCDIQKDKCFDIFFQS